MRAGPQAADHRAGAVRIISLVKTVPPGRLRWEPIGELWAFDESGPAEWTLDSLAAAAQVEGIEVGRSQVRRILLAEGVRWRRTRSWMRSKDPDFVQKDKDHRPLHPAARRRDGDLRRRAGTRDPPNFPARTRLVTRRAPDQSGARLQPRTGEDLGLRRPAAGRRPGPHHDRVLPEQRLVPAVPATGRGRQPRPARSGISAPTTCPATTVCPPGPHRGPPPHPPRFHPRRSLLAQPPRRLVAHLPQGRPRRPKSSPTPTTSRTPPPSRPANSTPAQSHGSGAGRHPNPTTATPICVQSLRSSTSRTPLGCSGLGCFWACWMGGRT